MNKYVFFTMNIGGINGAEQYIYNKVNFLRDKGYEVFIFSGRAEGILIDAFRKYEKYSNPAFRFFPYCLNRHELKNIISWIKSVVALQENDTCIIESSNVTSGLWGELIAKELQCKHLEINLTENHNYRRAMIDFLRFKLDRHELSGIMDDSVGKMLKEPNITLREDMRARAYCNNVVQKCEDHFSHLLDSSADYTFASIGRLEKEYVSLLLDQLKRYFTEHSEKRFNLLLIGGSADGRKLKDIELIFEECKNVNLVLTGSLYPIPRDLVKHADLFVSASGSASVTYYEKVPTIRIHHVTAEPMGIIGYDYFLNNPVKPEPLKDRNLFDCIDQIINDDLQIEYIEDFEIEYNEKMYKEFLRHLHFGEEAQAAYYNTLSIHYTDVLYRLCSYVSRVFGVKFAYAVLEMIRKLVRRTS